MLGLFLVAWVLFPAFLVLLTLGCGLVAQRLSRGAVPGVLLLPVGLATVIVVSVALEWRPTTAPFTGPGLIALALLGYALWAPSLTGLLRPTRAWVWPALGAAGAFAALAAPVVLSGRPSFTGYIHIVDIGHVFDFAAYVANEGRVAPATVGSSFEEVVSKMLSVSYPAGGQGPLGAISRTLGVEVPWLYQPMLAFHGAVAALAVYGLLSPLVASPAMRALAAAISTQASILYGMALSGGIKELLAATMLVLAAALLRAAPPRSAPVRALLPAALAVAAGISAFMIAIGPWLVVLFAALVLIDLLRAPRRGRALASWACLSALAVVLALPTLAPAAEILRSAAETGGAVDLGLGNLAEPVSPLASVGPWITGDHRFPLAQPTLTHVLIAIVLLLVAVGLARAIRSRDTVAPALALAVAASLVWVTWRTGPWIELKAFAITSMVSVAFAFVGAAALAGRRAGTTRRMRRFPGALGWVPALVVAGAVLVGNAQVYHDITVAPADRLRDLEQIGDDLAGSGPTLYPAFEEYAEFFLRRSRATSLVNPPNGQLGLRPRLKLPAGQQFTYDLDQFQLSYVQSFSRIVMRRNPTASRPPGNWQLMRQTRFHEVWRRARPSGDVRAHIPLAGTSRRAVTTCPSLSAELRRAGTGARVAYAVSDETVTLDLTRIPHPTHWPTADETLLTSGRGEIRGRVLVPRGGRYAAWVGGSFGRGVTISADGRPIGTLAYRPNYPRQIEYAGDIQLERGAHRILISRGGGDLHPGNGDDVSHFVGPLILARLPESRTRVHTVTATEGERVCRGDEPLDWIEVVRP